MADFSVTREAAVAYSSREDVREWAAPFLPCRFTELVQRAKTLKEIRYCVWVMRLDTDPGADLRRIKFALLCSRSIEQHTASYPVVKTCNDLVQRWLDGEPVGYSQIEEAARAARSVAIDLAAASKYYIGFAVSKAAAINSLRAAYAACDTVVGRVTYVAIEGDYDDSVEFDELRKILLEVHLNAQSES